MSNMEIYVSNSHAEDGGVAIDGVLGIVYASKEDVIRLCEFFEKVKEHLKDCDKCHMHFRDSFKGWEKGKHFDIEVNVLGQ